MLKMGRGSYGGFKLQNGWLERSFWAVFYSRSLLFDTVVDTFLMLRALRSSVAWLFGM